MQTAQLPPTGYLRLRQIIGCNGSPDNKKPPIPAIIPVSPGAWWAGVASGKYPSSVKLGPRTTAWKVEDIRALIASIDASGRRG